jgi:hypothetical protein
MKRQKAAPNAFVRRCYPSLLLEKQARIFMLACFLLRLKQMVEEIEAVPIELCLFFSAKLPDFEHDSRT